VFSPHELLIAVRIIYELWLFIFTNSNDLLLFTSTHKKLLHVALVIFPTVVDPLQQFQKCNFFSNMLIPEPHSNPSDAHLELKRFLLVCSTYHWLLCRVGNHNIADWQKWLWYTALQLLLACCISSLRKGGNGLLLWFDLFDSLTDNM